MHKSTGRDSGLCGLPFPFPGEAGRLRPLFWATAVASAGPMRQTDIEYQTIHTHPEPIESAIII